MFKFDKEKLKKNAVATGAAAGSVVGGAGLLYGALRTKSYFRKPDKEFEKDVRKSARSAANQLVKEGQGRWITIRGRRIFIPKDKKKYGTINDDLRFKDSKGEFWKTKLGKKLGGGR